jgi:transcriptional regulator with XRE-family HTH domain
MADLRGWLRTELKERGLTQAELAVYSGVGQATISDILRKGHVPKAETLCRLADYFHVSRERVLRLAGHLPPVVDPDAEKQEDPLVQALIEEFRRVPDEWKEVAVEQVAQFRRLAELRPVRIIGEEEAEDRGPEEASHG